mmetsp:Transcript_4159/g.15684  ORF Transcript_4159/g.15684 Transcript_4159/m.15684 type:complete len:287 (+) Transcript_4159:48-908(+)
MTFHHHFPQLIQPVNRQLLIQPITQHSKPQVKEGKRSDGRRAEEFRPLYMKTNVLQTCQGSAYVELKQTKVICAVRGPNQLPAFETAQFSSKGKLNVQVLEAPYAKEGFSRDQTQEKGGTLTKILKQRQKQEELSLFVSDALQSAMMLDHFPKCSIDLTLTILEDCGSSLSACVIAASLALASGGIPVKDLVSCCECCLLSDHILIDPNRDESYYSEGRVLCAYMTQLDEVTQLTQVGDMNYEQITDAMEMCLDACQKIHALMRETLLKHYSNGEDFQTPMKMSRK